MDMPLLLASESLDKDLNASPKAYWVALFASQMTCGSIFRISRDLCILWNSEQQTY